MIYSILTVHTKDLHSQFVQVRALQNEGLYENSTKHAKTLFLKKPCLTALLSEFIRQREIVLCVWDYYRVRNFHLQWSSNFSKMRAVQFPIRGAITAQLTLKRSILCANETCAHYYFLVIICSAETRLLYWTFKKSIFTF